MRNFIIFILCVILLMGCAVFKAAGNKSLDEVRIINAVNAERARWTTELSQRLSEGLGEIDQRVSNVQGGLQQITVAAREYRQFVLSIIDDLSKPEGEGTKVDNDPSSGNSNTRAASN